MVRRRPGLWSAIGLNLALLTVAVSVLDAGVFFLVTRRVLDDAATDLAVGTADILAEELTAVGQEGWKRVIDARRRAGTRELTLYGASGEVIAGEPGEAGPDVRAAFFSREVSVGEVGGHVVVFAPVGGPGRPEAVMRLGLPLSVTAAPAWVVIGAHAVFSAVLIVVFGLVLFRGSLLRPIEQMRDGTRRIAAGELGLQVSEEAPAEIAELAAALNTMSTALAGYRARTAEQLARLEAANVELRRTQEALLRSEKLASVGRLAAGLAHELGNPLTAVRGYVEILALGEVDSGDEVVARCQREVERMHRILRSLLDFARQEEPEVLEVDVRALLEEAVRTVEHQAPFRAIVVEVAVQGRPVLEGEADKLHQVLVNLLLNAAAAGARTIRLAARTEAGDVRITCTDDGEGIPEAHLGRLFEPFFTTRAPGEGTGLGLAVSHGILAQHGGRIDVSSVPGAGAVFSLRVPVVRVTGTIAAAPVVSV
ncbi:MAG: ATP-binding protein [Pseudomonadota bacterium]|nr:ATP-binding protein [Pseudomonadota bacterium]